MDRINQSFQSPDSIAVIPYAPTSGLATQSYYPAGTRYPEMIDDGESGNSLLEYGRILGRHKKTIILWTLAGILAGFLIGIPMPNKYRVYTTLEVVNLNEDFMNMKDASPTTSTSNEFDTSEEQTQAKLLQSQILLDRVFQKLSQLNNQPQEQATWQSFHQYVEPLHVLKLEHEQLIFSALVHADQLSRVRLGNDVMLKNEDNLKQGFSYRQLIRLYYHFTRKNIKKTALFKLQEALLKRRVSLFHEMMNFVQTNRKIKEAGEALKSKELVLSRQLMGQFLNELNTGLSEKDIKECLLLFDDKIGYNDLQSRLERIYQSASDDVGEQETLLNARRIYDSINRLGSSSERLFQDFDSSRKNCMVLADFNELCGFVNCGLNKIQIKEVFELAD